MLTNYNNKERKPRTDLQSSPVRPSISSDVSRFFTPPRDRVSTGADSAKQCWTVDFKSSAENHQLSVRPVVFSGQRLFKEEPEPLVPGMVDELSVDLERLRKLIEAYKQSDLSKADRASIDKKKNKLTAEIAKIVNQIILLSSAAYIKEKFPENNEDTPFIIRCLNTHTSFMQHFKIIARLGELDENSVWSTIKDYPRIQEQLVFEQKLKRLNIRFLPLTMLKPKSINRTRVVLTDVVHSNLGFESMFTWLDKVDDPNAHDEDKLRLKQAGPNKIAKDLTKLGITHADFEIAWGHLMNDGRHADEDIVFVSNMESLSYALNLCSQDSTLVLDGHGGANQFNIGHLRLQGPDLRKHIKNIVGLIGENITHVILSVCATGYLTLNEASVSDGKSLRRDKYKLDDGTFKYTHKNRKKIFVDANSIEAITSLFDKLSLDKSPESFASWFAALLLTRKNQSAEHGTAFTFSPSLLFPDSTNGGVISVPSSTSDRRAWPDYHTEWERDEREKDVLQIAFKGITLYNNINNRKSLTDVEWKKSSSFAARLFIM